MSKYSMFTCLESLPSLDNFQVMTTLHGVFCSQATQRLALIGWSNTPKSYLKWPLPICPPAWPSVFRLDLGPLDQLDHHPMSLRLTLLELYLTAAAHYHHYCYPVLPRRWLIKCGGPLSVKLCRLGSAMISRSPTGDGRSDMEDKFCCHIKISVWTQIQLFF